MKETNKPQAQSPNLKEDSDKIKPEKDVLREPGQISFKDALKKATLPGR